MNTSTISETSSEQREYNATCVRYRALQTENKKTPLAEDTIVWAVIEAGSTSVNLEELAKRGAKHYTKELIAAAAKETGPKREALLVCAAGRRDRVTEVMYDHFQIGPALQIRKEEMFRKVKFLRSQGLPDAAIEAASEIVGSARLGRIVASDQKFAAACVTVAIAEKDEQVIEALLQLASAGGQKFSRGISPFSREVGTFVDIAGADLVKQALGSKRSVHRTLANEAKIADQKGNREQADALYALSVTRAEALRAVADEGDSRTPNPGNQTKSTTTPVPVPRTFGQEFTRALNGASK